MTSSFKKYSCVMTIDVEDYFEVGAWEGYVSRRSWDNFEPRLKRNVNRVLQILEESGREGKATFFVLGRNARKYPSVVREIQKRGHEIACHGNEHDSVYNLGEARFAKEVRTAKAVLEDITGEPVLGFRAPNFSIRKDSLWAFKVLWEQGFRYDSSLYPVLHDRYGIPDAPRHPFYVPVDNGDLSFLSNPEYVNGGIDARRMVEFPLTTFRLLGRNIAVGGGGYLRIYPFSITRWGVRRAHTEGIPLILYLHPWEVDPGQPRMKKVPRLSRFRHYTNLHKTEIRLKRLLKDFAFDSFKMRYFDQASPNGIPIVTESLS